MKKNRLAGRVVSARNLSQLYLSLGFIAGMMILVGCSQGSSKQKSGSANPETTVDGSEFLLTSEPEGASNVIEVRESAKDSEEVVIVGRIGGSENPWVEGRAAFSIVDVSLEPCMDGCLKPWDYC